VEEKELLMIPGPTPVPQSVLRAQAKPMINHRGPAFGSLIEELTEGLKWLFQTKGEALILTGSGTGALEAAIVNVLSPGEQVLSVSIGAFGDRFAKIAETFGAKVEKLDFEWGKAADPEQVRARLKGDSKKEIKAVLVTHNETSTGVTNGLEAIAGVVREHGALVLVDGISSLVALDCQVDKWGLDVVAAASQKAFMVPPGLAFITMSERAWAANKQAKMPRFYWDLQKAKDFLDKGQTPWTPAVPQMFGLQEAMRQLRAEGLQACFARHERLGRMVRAGVKGLGLKLFADPGHASNAVTAICNPDGIDGSSFRKLVRERYGVVLAGGQERLKEKIFRIGHLGYVTELEILAGLTSVGLGLKAMGVEADPAGGLSAAQKALGVKE
jgi:aspartate aminotransferase-like enzyme